MHLIILLVTSVTAVYTEWSALMVQERSTFLRVLAGIYKPEKGEAYIDDAPIYENPKIKEM